MNKETVKVMVVSHSYVAAENQKNVDALSSLVQLSVVVPETINDGVFGALDANKHSNVIVYPRISLWGVQYLLRTIDLNLRQFQPNIIHVEYDPWSIIYWQVWLFKSLFARKAKLICTVKNNTYRHYSGVKGWFKTAIAHFFIKRCDFFIAVNKGVQNIYDKHFKVSFSKIEVMQHLGVDTVLFSPRVNDEQGAVLNIGFCGRFNEEKGIDDLLKAVTILINQNPNITLSLIGDGEMKNELLALNLPWLNVLERVPHNEVAAFMQTLDLFVLPSRISVEHEEHDAHALLEAMSCGVPVIGSTSGIIPEVIDGNSGLLFEAGNVDDLIMQLNTLIRSEQLREKYATMGVRRVNTYYSIDVLAKKKKQIYQQVLNSPI